MSERLVAIVLAAGEGTRMASSLAKPLHEVADRTMLAWILAAVEANLATETVVVVGHEAAAVASEAERAGEVGVRCVEQAERRGTGHAVQLAMASVTGDEGDAVILLGDTPLLRAATIAELVNTHRASGAALTVVGAEVADPTGYGRLVVRDGVLEAIVEEADASPEQRRITLINTGLMIARVAPLRRALAGLRTDNVKGELYLTDIVGLLRHAHETTGVYALADPNEAAGVNTPDQLAVADRAMRERLASR